MKNAKPTNKDVASALGLPAAVILTWIIGMFTVVPQTVAVAIGSICSFVAAYFVREK